MKGKVNIKKTLLVLCFFIISVFTFAEGENYYDYQALLVGDSKGNIFKKDNVNAVRPLASVTKVMTSMLTLEKIRSGAISMNDKVTISDTASVIPYGIKLVAGKQYTVEDLLKATIIRSSNNAAYALAEYVSGGDVPSFVDSMNSKAKQLGLNSLRFCTPHGLPPGDTGTCMDQGNAKDLYGLALKAIEFKEYLNISRNATDYIDGGEIQLKSTNALLGKVGGVDGLKTGYHKAAGSNIILTAQRGNDRVIVVILGSNKAKNRNAIGAEEINNYFALGGRLETSKKGKDGNFFKNLWTGLTKKSSNERKKDMGNGKTKVIDKNEVVKTVKIGNEKYNLYPAEDILVSGETGNKRIIYKVKLNSELSSKDRGKIVGQYSADDGVNEFTGSLIMR